MLRHRFMLLGVLTASLLASPLTAQSKAIPVKVVAVDGGWQLEREGKPYFVKGVGGDGSRKLLAAQGANSLRTWGADKLGPILDECQSLGLTVAVGIWLGHERHGFDYNNADQVADQAAKAREVVEKFKDHPAVLLWGLGNEMEGYEKGDNAAIWSTINNLASMVKRIDPNHPTMTVTAEIGGDRVKNIHRLCPEIDIVGINCYGGVASLPQRYREAGGTKPFLITEYGPPGTWESSKTSWGVSPELTSTAKAAAYRKAYETMTTAKGQCLGGYAFTWGNKQEATATWFGLLLPDGRRLGGVDALSELWTGKKPANRCPEIASLTLVGADQLDPGTTVKATLAASDPDGDAFKVQWVLQAEPSSYGVGGDAEEAPPTFPEAIVKGDVKGVEVQLPKDGGGYRLFAYLDDGKGNGAMANVPLLVKGPVKIPEARTAKLPLTVYDEGEPASAPFIPAGWMGNAKAVKLDPNCETKPHTGKTCIKLSYAANDGWAGVVWQSPAGDWGDKAGGWNLTGAKRITFWARGETGGESVSFQFGLLKDKKFSDSASGKMEKVELTTDWKQYSFDLSGKDLSRIKTGFCWVYAAEGKPATVYLDDIVYQAE